MSSITYVTRRDMLGRLCLACEIGTYVELSYQDNVICPVCDHEIGRWLTKREVMQIEAEVSRV